MKLIGKYVIFLGKLITHRETFKVYWQLFIDECVNIGINSIMLVSIVSFFVGAVVAVQTYFNLDSPFLPASIIGLIVREMMILELAPTLTAIVCAGKVGSQITGGLGSMRITEQIDALEVMGINSASYLVLPKILAGMTMFPLLVGLAGFLGIFGGYITSVMAGYLSPLDYIYGIRMEFVPFTVPFALIKSVVFGFLVTSIAAFKGFYASGGALEVGKASTDAVTTNCISILIADFLLANLLL